MEQQEVNEPVKLYLDEDKEPFKVAQAPLTFQFNTIALPDGPHRLRIEAPNGLAPPTIKDIPFVVRNGVAITVSGLEKEQIIGGQVQMVINAYAGNTEVDFEPRRAETPQPVPTWAWVVLLAILAWTLFYIINPQLKDPEAFAARSRPDAVVGERVYMDACARCHGEDGRGMVPKVAALRDADMAVAPTPADLLVKVAASTPGSMMPEWGTRLTNEEIVSVVNHVRNSWGHDSSQIELAHRRPPPGIVALHREFSTALKTMDVQGLLACCVPPGGITPQIFRTDGVDERGADNVVRVWQNYFAELGEAGAKVTQILLPDARYDYEPATVEQDGSVVIGTGRIFIETQDRDGRKDRDKGRFIRIYQRFDGRWTLVFDFADIRMAVGCLPGTEICPPPGQEGATRPPPVTPPTPSAPVEPVPGTTPPTPGPGPAAGGAIGYAEVQQYLKDLEKQARTAPHENFWEFSHQEFLAFRFPEDWGEDGMIRAVIPGDGKNSNLVKALRGGTGIVIELPDGTTKIRDDMGRMPKGADPMPEERIAAIEAWIDAGCPEFAGQAGTATPSPTPGPTATAPGPGAPATVPSSGEGIGYAEIQAIIQKLQKQARTAPHENFWELSYDEFVAFAFPEDFGEEGMIRAVVPYAPERSNLLRALTHGKGIEIRLPDGTTKVRDDMGRMPKGGPFLSSEDVKAVESWITDGCPEFAGKHSTQPRPGAAATTTPSLPRQDAPRDPFAPGPEQPGFPPPTQPASGFPAPSAPRDPAPGFPAPNEPAPGLPAPQAPGGFPAPNEPSAPGGFPAPNDTQTPGGFPAPSEPAAPGGFPAPNEPAAPGGFPPAKPPSEAPGFPPPAPPSGTQPGGAGPSQPKRPVVGPVISFEEVKAVLKDAVDRSTAVYGVAFWVLPHADFVTYRFPIRDDDGGEARLLIPGSSGDSNLIRYLLDGKGIVIDRPDGKQERVDHPRWPRGGPYLSAEQIDQLRAWIDAWCPVEAIPAPEGE